MKNVSSNFGTVNPKAPTALKEFAFLIGEFRCEAKIDTGNGQWQDFTAQWSGQFILDGFVIADEYQMFDSSGALIVRGMNFRAYDEQNKCWNIKWLNALTGTWTDLGSPEVGGVSVEGDTITYALKEPMAGHKLTRASYIRNSPEHFTWLGDKLEDGKIWTRFMVVEAHRIRP